MDRTTDVNYYEFDLNEENITAFIEEGERKLYTMKIIEGGVTAAKGFEAAATAAKIKYQGQNRYGNDLQSGAM